MREWRGMRVVPLILGIVLSFALIVVEVYLARQGRARVPAQLGEQQLRRAAET